MNRKFLFACIVVDLAAISIIPNNVMLLDKNMPEFVGVILSLIVIVFTVLYMRKSKGEKISQIVAAILAVVTVTICSLGTYCNPYWNGISFRKSADYRSMPYHETVSSEMALEDLGYAMKYLKKLHPALYHSIPENIYEQYENVKSNLKQCSDIKVNDLAKEIESIFSMLEDGHTSICCNDWDEKILKYIKKWNEDGYKITAVNGISIEELLETKRNAYSFETESWERHQIGNHLVTDLGLDYLGFDISDGIEYTLESKQEDTITVQCCEADFISSEEYQKLYGSEDSEEEKTEESFIDYEIDTKESLAILHLRQCIYNEEYRNCLKKLFEEVKEKQVKNVAVDLRSNGGGNSAVVNEFFRYLDIESYKTVTMDLRLGYFCFNLGKGTAKNSKYDDLLFKGNLYLLTSTGTYSSAMMFAEYVKDNQVGTIIGEAPGNSANQYGEVVMFKLPNSQLLMQISTKLFHRADKECKDNLVYPDRECDADLAMDELYKVIRGA